METLKRAREEAEWRYPAENIKDDREEFGEVCRQAFSAGHVLSTRSYDQVVFPGEGGYTTKTMDVQLENPDVEISFGQMCLHDICRDTLRISYRKEDLWLPSSLYGDEIDSPGETYAALCLVASALGMETDQLSEIACKIASSAVEIRRRQLPPWTLEGTGGPLLYRVRNDPEVARMAFAPPAKKKRRVVTYIDSFERPDIVFSSEGPSVTVPPSARRRRTAKRGLCKKKQIGTKAKKTKAGDMAKEKSTDSKKKDAEESDGWSLDTDEDEVVLETDLE